MKKQAILFHPEGDFVRDFTDRATVEDVWTEVNNMGSRWIFYPIPFVATDKTIVDTIDELAFLKGRRITTVKKYFKQMWVDNKDEICEALNNGYPLNIVYPNIF